MSTQAIVNADDDLKISLRERESTSVGVVVRTVDEAITIAKAFALSGMFPDARNAGQALAKILMGAECGFSPAASMNAIHFVQGKLQLSGVAIGTLIRNSKARNGRNYDYRVLELTEKVCSIDFTENGNLLGNETFTHEDAIRQGTGADSSSGSKGNLKKFPKNMLYNRAMSNGAKFYTPEIFGGASVYTEGEIPETEATEEAPATNRADSIINRIKANQAPEEPPVDSALTIEAHLAEIGLDIDQIRDFKSACESKNVDPEKGREFDSAIEAMEWIDKYVEGSLL